MPGRVLVELKELAFDCPHSRHQPVELDKETLLVLLGLVHRIGGRTVADPVESIGQLPIQKPHVQLQIQEFLVQLSLLEHGWHLA
jgi:hypothetical protein